MIKKTSNRKNYRKEEYLPIKLIKKLQEDIFSNSGYEYRTKNNFLQCVAIIHFHQVTNGIGLNDYAPLGSGYWKKVFGGNYHESVIQPLLKHKIIESLDFGYRTFPNTVQASKGKQDGSVGIRYRINPDLMDNQYETISYIGKGKALTATERMLLGKQEFIPTGIADMDFRVTIDPVKAFEWVENNAESICNEFLKRDYVQSLPDNMLIQYHEYLDKGSYNIKYMSAGFAKNIAENRNQELFYFKDTFYIADVSEFLKKRVPALIYHYKNQILLIHTQPIEEKRNPVTLRLYSNLVNFPSKILQFININNSTIFQLDLRTSQFLIFANLLNVYINKGEEHLLSLFKQERSKTYLKRLIRILQVHQKQLPTIGVDINDRNSGQYSSTDVTNFIRDVFFTDFYAVVQQELRLKDRVLAKRVLFKLLFKKTNRPDALLNKLSQRYPIVMSIIASFKKQDAERKKSGDQDENRESNFSVFLQCIEGEIFVDNILEELRTDGVPCFTRHDSIVVADGHEAKAEEIAKNVFKKFGFKYNHKVEDKFWEVVDFEELEDSGYLEWLADETDLNTDFSVEESYEEPKKAIIEETDEILTSTDEEKIEIMDETELNDEQLETLERLKDIGLQKDYFKFVDLEFLEEISELPFLTDVQRNYLYDDIINIKDGMSFFQDETNELLRNLVNKF
jgi:hypothetical protein